MCGVGGGWCSYYLVVRWGRRGGRRSGRWGYSAEEGPEGSGDGESSSDRRPRARIQARIPPSVSAVLFRLSVQFLFPQARIHPHRGRARPRVSACRYLFVCRDARPRSIVCAKNSWGGGGGDLSEFMGAGREGGFARTIHICAHPPSTCSHDLPCPYVAHPPSLIREFAVFYLQDWCSNCRVLFPRLVRHRVIPRKPAGASWNRHPRLNAPRPTCGVETLVCGSLGM